MRGVGLFLGKAAHRRSPRHLETRHQLVDARCYKDVMDYRFADAALQALGPYQLAPRARLTRRPTPSACVL